MKEFEKENTVVGMRWSVGWFNSVKHIETHLDKKFIEFITLVGARDLRPEGSPPISLTEKVDGLK
jgi:hypothetical protein